MSPPRLRIHPVRYKGHAIHYIYVLKSDPDRDFYVGFTRNLNRRIKEHTEGIVKSTKK
ncbi:MAG TPA: GIY-YIG nuclease family protein [bacterium]